jgi:hypothetical protein
MSFVIGFVSGMATGESIERRNKRRRFRQFMEQRKFTIIDQHGQPVSLDTIMDEVLSRDRHQPTEARSRGILLAAGVAIVALVAISGGTAFAIGAAS